MEEEESSSRIQANRTRSGANMQAVYKHAVRYQVLTDQAAPRPDPANIHSSKFHQHQCAFAKANVDSKHPLAARRAGFSHTPAEDGGVNRADVNVKNSLISNSSRKF